jgi:hypothetical protein
MTRRPKAQDIHTLAAHQARPPLPATDPATWKILDDRWGPNLIDNAAHQMATILKNAAHQMATILKDAGLPTEARLVFRTNRGRYVGLDRLVVQRGHQVGCELWYAAKILEEIATLRDARGRADRDEILDSALHLGALLMEANIVVSYGQKFDVGVTVWDALARRREGGNAKRRAIAAPDHQRWIAAAQIIWNEKNPPLRVLPCARKVITRLKLAKKVKTVADVIRSHRPKKTGDAK